MTALDHDKTRAELKRDLRNLDPQLFVLRWIFDTIPVCFESDSNWSLWKHRFACELQVDPCAIFFVGSCVSGVSLHPEKKLKAFDAASDIDIAVVSRHHFEIAWRTLRNIGTKRYDMKPPQLASLDDHRTRLIYWGAVDTKCLLPFFEFGKGWAAVLSRFGQSEPFVGRELKTRIYRDSESLVAYHIQGLQALREQLRI